MKPISARWIVSAYDYLKSESGTVCSGFVEAGISEALGENESSSDQGDDPFVSDLSHGSHLPCSRLLPIEVRESHLLPELPVGPWV